MQLIKLGAIDSTNDYLKELSKNELLDNFTTVTALNQTKGKGQMGSVWVSEIGKNLILSTLIKDLLRNADQVYHLNVVISISIIQVLQELHIPKLAIKWPNDIMSGNCKIAGILIENRLKSDTSIESIVGIGLNVNQKDFDFIPKASSLTLIMNKEFELESLLQKIISKIKGNCELIISNKTEQLWRLYYSCLFKKDKLMAFEDANKNIFKATILSVTQDGRLEVIFEDKSIKTFAIKEVKMQY